MHNWINSPLTWKATTFDSKHFMGFLGVFKWCNRTRPTFISKVHKRTQRSRPISMPRDRCNSKFSCIHIIYVYVPHLLLILEVVQLDHLPAHCLMSIFYKCISGEVDHLGSCLFVCEELTGAIDRSLSRNKSRRVYISGWADKKPI